VEQSGRTYFPMLGNGVETAVVNDARRLGVLRGRSHGEVVVLKRDVVLGLVCGVL
jgi:hypothetical protein